MSTALTERTPTAGAIERVLIEGDLSKLTPEQRVSYYNRVCESLGLNPLTKPFAYLKLSGKETLYALRDAAEQLRKLHGVSIIDIQTQRFEDVYVVTVKAQDKTGRTDASTGAVPLGMLKGEALANALMKAETKAKRRVTLSICGLGMLDETEVASIPTAGGYVVDAPQIAVPERGEAGEAAKSSRPRPPATALPQSDARPAGERAEDDANGFHLGTATPRDALYIERLEVIPTANKNVRKVAVILSDGRQVTTIREQLAALAEQMCQDRDPVTVETKTTKWGEDLVALHRVERVIQLHDDEEDHTAPVDLKDVPF